ncbi:sensor histidine kinase [Cytophaga aurantiaca]|uniref:sensor histidine kinase n=1 Tax=Cytophaga aurantiaca TaxID=29530 RepID=UPI0003A9488D|nr:sensor histidine kinase [Cytophaga aurantiaca]
MTTNNRHAGGKYVHTFNPNKAISPDSALRLAKNYSFKKNGIDIYSRVSTIKQPVWVYFKTDSFISSETHFLVIENCNFNLITLYAYQNDSLKLIERKGMSLPYQKDNLFPEQTSFCIQPNTIYFIEAYDLFNIVLPIFIRTNTVNIKSSVFKNYFNGFYWGVISVMGIVALFFFIRSKERAFLYYSLFLFGTIVLNLCLEGYLFAYFWPDHPEINTHKIAIYALSAITTPLFVYHFLDIKSYYPGTKFVFLILTGVFLLIPIMSFMGWYAQALYSLQMIAFLQIIVYIVYGISIWKKGNQNALYFILAWSLYLSSIVFAVLSSLNIIPRTTFVNNYVQIGTLIQGGIFSFIMAGKYQQYKLTHIQSQEKIIDVLKERELLLTNQNDTLETTVFNRTQELNRTNNELNTLNTKLNELVSQKTWELQKSLEEIVSTNNQLHQFNYITSHNLRGPVSSLKGLIELYSEEKDATERAVYIEKIRHVINRMDEILIDLNKILSYRNSNSIKELIDFETMISNNLRQLEIQRIQVNLYIDPSLEIYGIKSFYESIFYNLLTNAQKYSSPERTLKITIQIIRLAEHRFTLTVSDNGIGMDESKTGDKLFGFYKRFHTHVEGKGLGLYITKNQIDMLGGTIRAESELNVGTTFIIELPC